jgi:homoserine dehydrogenase
MTKNIINIGFLGFGNVGSGAVRILQENKDEISKSFLSTLKVKTIFSPNIANRDKSWVEGDVNYTTDPYSVINDPEIDIVVEAIGGLEPALTYINQAFENGKNVVTANKLLLARHGIELAKKASSNKLSLGIEASVAGGIPIINAIKNGISGEKITSICGILNGTTNFILTEMERSGAEFDSTLSQAQKLGYAEADPTLDIEGLDARDKLAILSMLCFGNYVDVENIPTEGITKLTPLDFTYASQARCTIKLLCIAKRLDNNLLLSVAPTLVPNNSLLAKVNGSFNAVMITGSSGGQTFYYGRGAGSGPTGIAIVSDIIHIARELTNLNTNFSPTFRFNTLEKATVSEFSQASSYSVRFTVNDHLGVVAKLAAILSENGINIYSVSQNKTLEKKTNLSFVIMLEPTTPQQLKTALEEIKKLDFLIQPPLVLRVEENV